MLLDRVGLRKEGGESDRRRMMTGEWCEARNDRRGIADEG